VADLKGRPDAIRDCAKNIRQYASGDQFNQVRQHLHDTVVGFPAFGLLGLPLGFAYDRVRDTYLKTFEAGIAKFEEIADKLGKTADTIERADQASTIKLVE
jgi:hypothetical protein